MCGIFAAVNQNPVTQHLLTGLSCLSYRGYDSSGIAVIENGLIRRQRAAGKLENLRQLVEGNPIQGLIGIAHTRWATHGLPTEKNAHPHMTEEVAVAHNGIVENHHSLKLRLEAQGCEFQSETDSESIAQLITFHLRRGMSCQDALRVALQEIEGSYGLVVLFRQQPDQLYVARRGSPLVIGRSNDGYFVSSDENALSGLATQVYHLQDGELGRLSTSLFRLRDIQGNQKACRFVDFHQMHVDSGKDGFDHFMLKEIHEQPAVFDRCLRQYLSEDQERLEYPIPGSILEKVSRLTIVACGTSFYAGQVAKYWIERVAGLPVDVDIASEFRYRQAPLDQQSLAVFVSQSGETADTYAALQHARKRGLTCLAIVNVVNSTIAREADYVLPIHAGTEVGVASTKAFIAQLTTFLGLTLALGRASAYLGAEAERALVAEMLNFPEQMSQLISQKSMYSAISRELRHCSNALFLGRGISSALAQEGALKLKEISYIHAEAYPAGELKHGPLALVDEHLPVIMIAPRDELLGKSLSNLREVAARGGRIILFSDKEGIEECRDFIVQGHALPPVHELLQPLQYTIPLQLLAYYTALIRGNDVDQPRNLAKSVTVE